MSWKDNVGNEPAFPFNNNQLACGSTGMTIRLYFVAQAMNGLLSAYVGAGIVDASKLAEQAVFAADATLARELETRP